MPKVSVIMGVFNTPIDYLNKSIESILSQTYSDFELIIVNDGSNDECSEALNELSKKDNRINVLNNEKNMGLTYSLNKAIAYSNGKYLARMDSDDYCDPCRFEKQIELLEGKKADMIATNSYLFEDDEIWGSRCYPEYISKKDFLSGSPVTHPTIMATKESILKIGCYNDIKRTTRCEDYDLFMRYAAAGFSIYTIQEKLYYFREDLDAAKRRKYKYRICEFKTRIAGYKKLGILFPRGIFYAFKPLIVGLLPLKLYRKLKKKREKND